MAAPNFTVASLFSGCGGFDLGFEDEGFRPVAAFDIDSAVVDSYRKNVARVAEVCDLSQTTPDISADVLIAGSPCQGFSTSGKRDLSDPRNDLLIRAGEIAIRSRPRVFILENVPAAISGRHGSRWEQVEGMLRSAGYFVSRITAEGTSSGVPQLRKRLFLFATLTEQAPNPSHEDREAPDLATALSGVDELSGHEPILLKPGSGERIIASRIGQGQKLCNVRMSDAAVATWNIPEVFGSVSETEVAVLEAIVRLRRRDRRRDYGDADPVLPSTVCDFLSRCCEGDIERLISAGYLRRVEQYIDLRHTYNGKFRRLHLNRPSPTVDTHFGDPRLFLHPTQDRGLTAREAARIQGFKDDFELPDGRALAFRMIGNAVPPPMGAKLARLARTSLTMDSQ